MDSPWTVHGETIWTEFEDSEEISPRNLKIVLNFEKFTNYIPIYRDVIDEFHEISSEKSFWDGNVGGVRGN